MSLRRDPPAKSSYKELIMTKITAFHEDKLRKAANGNSLMTYLNVSTLGLRGRHHPALANMKTTNDVRTSRPHLKLLSGNYLTYKVKSDQSGGSPDCRICISGIEESVSHVVSWCGGMTDDRTRIFTEFRRLCNSTKNRIDFDEISRCENNLTQFILDPTSLNLPVRVHMSDPLVPQFFKLSREFCYIIDKTRIGLLKNMEKERQAD